MIEGISNKKEDIYEIDNKKYKVITKCIENSQNKDKIYEILCKFAISKLTDSK